MKALVLTAFGGPENFVLQEIVGEAFGRARLRCAVERAPKSSGRKISRPATYVPAGSSRGNGAE